MKRQQITPATIASPASNALDKGLQQYWTPYKWAEALGAALPDQRRTIADLHCGRGTLAAALATTSTHELLGLDLDPQGGMRERVAHLPFAQPKRHFAHGDVLDLLPLLLDTGTRFDLLALNPPFSLQWPLALLPEPLRKGLGGKAIDSTHATLRMIPPLLNDAGEALLIANQSTLDRLRQKHPDDFAHAWLWLSLRNFFPGVDGGMRVGVLYLARNHDQGPSTLRLDTGDPAELARILREERLQSFRCRCVEGPWESDTRTWKRWEACTQEMERRRDPTAANANVLLTEDGRLRTWVTAYQEASESFPADACRFLREINRRHPMELTIQRGTRLALEHVVKSGLWTLAPEADAAIRQAIEEFERDRSPIYPISEIQRVGWLDEAEELECCKDFGPFEAGKSYPLTSETLEWHKTELRPRYRAGVRDEEEVAVKGADLRITLLAGERKAAFMYNPDVQPDPDVPCFSLQDLADHFVLPEVPHLAELRPDEFAEKLALLDQLEELTP